MNTPESFFPSLIEYTAFDKETGQVCAWGTDPNPASLSSDRVGIVLNVQYKDGWIDIADISHHTVPEQPSPHHTWDWVAKAWTDPRTLADLKAAKWEEIKRARDAAEAVPLQTPLGTFDADAKGRKNLTDSILLLQSLAAIGEPAEIQFTLADNTVVTIDLPQIVQVGIALGLQVQAAYNIGRQLRGLIDAASSPEQLQAISWPSTV